jgi:hypothetical protein
VKVARHRILIAAVLVGLEIAAAHALANYDPGARLLSGGEDASIAVVLLGAFFCLRVIVYFVVPPALAVGLVALVLPRTEFSQAFAALRESTARLSRFRRLLRLG